MLQASRFTERVNERIGVSTKALEIMKYRVDEYLNLLRSKGATNQEWSKFLSTLEEQLTSSFDSNYQGSILRNMYTDAGKEYPYEDLHPFLFIVDESNNQQEEVTLQKQKLQADFSYDIFETYSIPDEVYVYDSSIKEPLKLKVVHTYEGSIYYNDGEVTLLEPVHVSTRNFYIYE